MSGDFSNWYSLDPDDRVVAYTGDSTVFGTANTTYGPPQLLRNILSTRWGSASLGLQTLIDGWGFAGSWQKASLSDTWDVGPMRGEALSLNFCVQLGNAAADIVTW